MRGVWIVGLVLLAVASAGVAAANQPPMAEAGLDQEAVVNGTVYLDAGGSLDPDGRIVDYTWSIETPAGNTTTPACVSCAQTKFVPRENGTYAVTVTVTDDGGASTADTMYVYVEASSVQDTSPPRSESRETAVSAPSSSVGGDGGGRGGGGASIALDSVAADSAGDKFLLNRDGGNFVFHTRTGERVRISQQKFNQLAGEDGKVSWEKAKNEFRREGVTEGDIDDSMQDGNCGGFTCTSYSDATGEAFEVNAEEIAGTRVDVDTAVGVDVSNIDLGPSGPVDISPGDITVDPGDFDFDVDP